MYKRQLEHVTYTPAPDIIHEAAGHAPIIANTDYADYLCAYGEVAKKAIQSKHDSELYKIIKKMSDMKEDPNVSKVELKKIEVELLKIDKDFEKWLFRQSIQEGERLKMVDPTPHLKNRYGSATELGKGIDVNEQVISLLSRKSIRVFKDKRISRELLETLIACSQSAPTKSNLQQYSIQAST